MNTQLPAILDATLSKVANFVLRHLTLINSTLLLPKLIEFRVNQTNINIFHLFENAQYYYYIISFLAA